METAARNHLWLANILFWALLLALVAPIWIFTYFPSTDGPSHLFNAWVYANYDRVAVFRQAFTLHVPFAGNLTGHALAILLLKIGVAPEVCEKLLATLAIAGLAAAFRFAVTAFSSEYFLASFLIFPFLYNWPMQMGFWSFALGVPFLFVCVGLFFRYRGHWNLASFLCLFLAAGAAYLCHPIAWAICALTVGFLAVFLQGAEFFRGPNRLGSFFQVLIPVAAFLPFAIPNFLFAEKNSHVEWQHFSSIRTWIWPLYTNTPIHLFNGDVHAARAVFFVLCGSSFGNFLYKLFRRTLQPADALLPSALLILIFGLFSPGRIGEGTFIEVRMLLFGMMLLALWLGLTLPLRDLKGAAALALVATAWLIASRLPDWRAANEHLKSVVELSRAIPANAYVCQLDFVPQGETIQPFIHAVDLLPNHDFIDVRDYEAGRSAFWTHFRPGYFLDEDYMHPATDRHFEAAINDFERATGKHVDYVMLTEFKGSSASVMQKELPSRYTEYQLIGERQPWVAIYKRSGS